MGVIAGVVLSQLIYGVLSNPGQADTDGGSLNGFFLLGNRHLLY